MAETFAKPEHLRQFMLDALAKSGASLQVSQDVADGLAETSLRGIDSHGVRLFPVYFHDMELGRTSKNPKFTFSQAAPSTGVLDAGHTFGIAAGKAAMRHAISLARATGIGAVAVKNSNHFSAAGIYGLMAARQNMIGMCFTHAESTVLLHGGKKPFLGTNPLCFCAPMEGEEPFCLDMATSVVPRNKVLSYKEKGKPLESGWAADADGNETLDPSKFSSLFPLGGYKGYGLSLMVEILCSALTGMEFGPHILPFLTESDKRYRNLGHFFLAIDISKFQDITAFKKRMKQMADSLRSSPPANPASPVLIAGDPEKQAFALRSKKGIPLTETDVRKFSEIAAKLGMGKSFLENK